MRAEEATAQNVCAALYLRPVAVRAEFKHELAAFQGRAPKPPLRKCAEGVFPASRPTQRAVVGVLGEVHWIICVARRHRARG